MDDNKALVPLWKDRLGRVFDVLERRRAEAMQQRVVSEAEFRWFVQSVAIPAFRQFRDSLAEHGDHPEYYEGEDWVGFRWTNGHTLAISPLLRAPARASAALGLAQAYRRQEGKVEIRSLTDVTSEDVLLWLVRQYALRRRVSDSEIGM